MVFVQAIKLFLVCSFQIEQILQNVLKLHDKNNVSVLAALCATRLHKAAILLTRSCLVVVVPMFVSRGRIMLLPLTSGC